MNTASVHVAASAASGNISNSNLIFGLGAEEYAIDIALVQELRGYGSVTRLADAPAYMTGVINLRGIIVPLIDLRIRFGNPAPSYNDTTVVVILIMHGKTTGIVVDRVADVVNLEPDQIKPAPQLRQGGAEHVLAIASVEQRMLILLDIEALLDGLTMHDAEAALCA